MEEVPLMIPLSGLELVTNPESNYGLSFKITDDAEIIEARILTETGKFKSDDVTKKTGLPKVLRKNVDFLRNRLLSGVNGKGRSIYKLKSSSLGDIEVEHGDLAESYDLVKIVLFGYANR